jgi:hypothetical protein
MRGGAFKNFVCSSAIAISSVFFSGLEKNVEAYELNKLKPSWEKTYSAPNGNGMGVDIDITDNGDLLLVGREWVSRSEQNTLILRADKSGNRKWGNVYDFRGVDRTFSVNATSDNGAIVGAEKILKLDSFGKVEWEYSQKGHAIQTENGEFVISGEPIQRLNPYGFKYVRGDIWTPSPESIGLNIIKTRDNGFAMTAFSVYDSTAGLDPTQLVYFAKTNDKGEVVSYGELGELGYYYSPRTLIEADGGFILTGEKWKYPHGWYDGFLWRMDYYGNLLEEEVWGGEFDDAGRDVIQTKKGDFIVSGYKTISGEERIRGTLRKIDRTFNLIEEKVFPYGIVIIGVHEKDDENLLVTGLKDSEAYLANLQITDKFRRGDSDGDGRRNISDIVFSLDYLFRKGVKPGCMRSADVDDDGFIDLSDVVYSLNHEFLGGPRPVDPFFECGDDTTFDELTCYSFPSCSDIKREIAGGGAGIKGEYVRDGRIEVDLGR